MPKKSKKSVQKALPIVFVPDISYINDAGGMIPTDVILVSDPVIYKRIGKVLEAWGKEQLVIQKQREQEFRVGEGA